jgi:hypothetical protein
LERGNSDVLQQVSAMSRVYTRARTRSAVSPTYVIEAVFKSSQKTFPMSSALV